jgi:hypothetical protein
VTAVPSSFGLWEELKGGSGVAQGKAATVEAYSNGTAPVKGGGDGVPGDGGYDTGGLRGVHRVWSPTRGRRQG